MPWKEVLASEARMRFVLAYKEKGESFSWLCRRFCDQPQEWLQVAEAVSRWGSTGAGGPVASAWLLRKSVSLFLARTVDKSARSASAVGSEEAAECSAEELSWSKMCSGREHVGALAEPKWFGAQRQEARSVRSFARVEAVASSATVQPSVECGFQRLVSHAGWPALRSVDRARCV
jgi:hypothetical protein